MEFTHLNGLEMEDQSLFAWVRLEEALEDTTYISDPRISLALYGGALDPTTELQDLPPSVDSLHISPISAVPQEYYHLPPYDAPDLDDINFDSFPWDDAPMDSNEDMAAEFITPGDQYSSISIAYHLADTPCEGRKDCSGLTIVGAITGVEGVKKKVEKGWSTSTSVRTRSSSISFEEVSKHFCLPIMEAAKAMKVGLTVLKKRCRELGISRWPHRKMKSLNSLIRNVQELGRGVAGEDSIRREVETLEEHKRLMEKIPEMQLTERTKRLRQACFKANFKKRRALQSPCFNTHPSVLLLHN